MKIARNDVPELICEEGTFMVSTLTCLGIAKKMYDLEQQTRP